METSVQHTAYVHQTHPRDGPEDRFVDHEIQKGYSLESQQNTQYVVFCTLKYSKVYTSIYVPVLYQYTLVYTTIHASVH